MIPLLIARNTFREATRDRVLAGVVVAGLALLALTQAASSLAMGEGRRLLTEKTPFFFLSFLAAVVSVASTKWSSRR